MKPRRDPKKLIIGTTATLAAVVSVWLFARSSPPPEPHFDGKPMSYWVKELYRANSRHSAGSHEKERFDKVNKALLALGTNSAPPLAKALMQPPSRLYQRCHKFYFALQSELPRSLGRILPRLYSPVTVRSRAAWLLKEMGPNARTAAPQLVQGLQSGDPETRRYCVQILALIGTADEPVLQGFVAALHDPDIMVRELSAYALGKLAFASKRVVPALIAALGNSDPNVRDISAEALGKFTNQTEETIPALLDAVRKREISPSVGVRALASTRAGNEPVRAALLNASQDTNSAVRALAVRALRAIDARHEDTLPRPADAAR